MAVRWQSVVGLPLLATTRVSSEGVYSPVPCSGSAVDSGAGAVEPPELEEPELEEPELEEPELEELPELEEPELEEPPEVLAGDELPPQAQRQATITRARSSAISFFIAFHPFMHFEKFIYTLPGNIH